MSDLFLGCKNCRVDISQWDTSNVRNMACMFCDSDFNGNISNWNTSKVKNMRSMFCASKFNGDLSKWNTSNVTDMVSMFYRSKFKGDISNWNILKVENLHNIFQPPSSKNIPYWATIEDMKERQQAYLIYQEKQHLEKNLLVNNIKNNKEVFKI